MTLWKNEQLLSVLVLGSAIFAVPALAQVPDSIAAPDHTAVASFRAEGAQIYECKADPSGKLVWVFREPIATLLMDGKTVGRHYAGPNWELQDGSAIVGKAIGNAPGATSKDIPWLKLEAASKLGSFALSGVTMVQRVNTRGGKLDGDCEQAGAFSSVPYSADYIFLRPGN